MEAVTTTQPPRRRRRSPQEAEREIITAAESLLRERPFRELTVDEVMRRTGLSRPSFYVYFRDRHHLVLRVVEHIGGELFTMSNRWFEGDDAPGPDRVRAALQGVVEIYELHGPVMKALADAAADDPDVERVYADFVEGFVVAAARHIDEEIAAGHVPPMDARHVAEALVWMNERFLNAHLGRERTASAEVVAETLTGIWSRTIYGV